MDSQVLCTKCGLLEGSKAHSLTIACLCVLRGDTTDGKIDSALKFVRRNIYRLLSYGLTSGDGTADCFCVLIREYTKAKPTEVLVTTNACKCCNLQSNERISNMFETALVQIRQIEEKVNRPLVMRLNKKMNVLVNLLRQLQPYCEEACVCDVHAIDDRCACGVKRQITSLAACIREKIIGCSGVEQVSVEEKENVAFADQRLCVSDQGMVTGDVSVSHRQIAMSEDEWSLRSVLGRPMMIGNLEWKKDVTSVIKRFHLPGGVIFNTFQRIINSFSYFRGSLIIRAQVNGTKFHVGKLMMYYVPYTSESSLREQHDIAACLAFPNVILDASLANSGEINIPFLHLMSYFPVNKKYGEDYDPRFLGSVIIQALNSLKVSSSATQVVPVTLWAYFKDVELHQPLTNVGVLPVGASGFLNAALELGNTAKSFGLFDKPGIGRDPERWVPVAISDIAHGEGTNMSTRLGLKPKAGVVSNSGMCSALDSDMNVLTLCKMKSRLSLATWNKSAPSGKLLTSIPVCPSMVIHRTEAIAYTKYDPTMLAYCSRAFNFWRGSLELTVDCASSIMHSGRLAIIYVAGMYDKTQQLDVVRDGSIAILDLQEAKSLTVRIPYMAPTPWLRCDKFYTLDDVVDERFCSGYVYVFVLNQLGVPASTPVEVHVNVLLGAGDDFQLAVPSSFTGFLSNAGVPAITPGVLSGRDEVVESKVEVVVPQPDDVKEKPEVGPFSTAPVGVELHSTYNTAEKSTRYNSKPYFVWNPLNNVYEPQGLSVWKLEGSLNEPPQDGEIMPRGRYNFRSLFHNFSGSPYYDYFFDPKLFYFVEPRARYDRDTSFYYLKFRVKHEKYITEHIIYISMKESVKEFFSLIRYLRSVEIDGCVPFKEWWLAVIGRELPVGMTCVNARHVPIGLSGVEHVPETRTDESVITLSLGNAQLMNAEQVTMSEDGMSLQTVLRRHYPTFSLALNLANADISNIPYISFPVTPCIGRENRVLQREGHKEGKVSLLTVGANNYSTLNHFASLFSFWRGSMRYKLLINHSLEKDMSIAAIYLPTISTNYNLGRNYLSVEKMVSLMQFGTVLYQGKVQGSVEFEVPFNTIYNQLETQNIITSVDFDLKHSSGTIVVFFTSTSESLNCHLTLYSAIGDDCMFTYLRAPPPIYTDKFESKKPILDTSTLGNFRLGTALLNNSAVPIGHGLFSIFSKTSEVVDELHKNLPQMTETLAQVNKLTSVLSKMLTGTLHAIHGIGLVNDIVTCCEALYNAIACDDAKRLFYIGRIILTFGLRIGVSIGWIDIGSMISSVWSFLVGWWPKVRNTPIGASGSFDVIKFFLPVCVAVTGLVFGKALPTDVSGMCKTILPYFRVVNDGSRAASTLLSWVEPFITWLKVQMAEKLKDYFPGIAAWLKVTDRVGEIIEWMKDIDSIDEETAIAKCARDPNYRMFCMHLYDKSLDYIEHIARGDDKHLATVIRSYAKVIARVQRNIGLSIEQPTSRIDPYCLCLVGPPGCGKSAIVPTLMHRLLNRLNYPRANRMYARNTSDKFWSRYKGEFVTVIDDYDQIVDSPAMAELIDLKTNNVYQLNMADVAEKGKLFLSDFIVLTSNNMYPSTNMLSETQALWRRRNVLIEVVPNNFEMDTIDWTHMWFRLRSSTDPNADSGRIMSLDELLDYLEVQARVYLNAQRALVLRNEQLAIGVGQSRETFKLDVDAVMKVPELQCFSHEMYDSLEATRDGTDWYWVCSTDDEDILAEWNEFNGMMWNLKSALGCYLKRRSFSRINEFRDYLMVKVDMIWNAICDHPVYCTVILGVTIFIGIRYFASVFGGTRIACADYYSNVVQKPHRVYAIAASAADVNAINLVDRRILPYIYRIRVRIDDELDMTQNAFAIGRRWIMTTKHFFTNALQKREPLKFMVWYNGANLEFQLDSKDYRCFPDKDLIALNLDVRFHEHKSNMHHFVRSEDLGKLRDVPCVYVGGWNNEEKRVIETRASPLEEMYYVNPVSTAIISIYRAWQYPGVDKAGSCGGVLVATETKLKNKILGIHCAGSPGLGYSHVVTYELLRDVLGEISCNGLELPAVVAPLPSTFPDGHFGHVGIVEESVGAVNKTELVPSVIQGLIGDVSTAPSVLSSKDPRLSEKISPLYLAISKLGIPSVGIEKNLYALLRDYKALRYRVLDRKYCRVLTESEAILGIDGVEYLDRINMSTSAGYPYTRLDEAEKGKLWLFDDSLSVKHPLLRARLDEREAALQMGDRIQSVWIDCLKDEKRPLAKVHSGNTRLFQIPPLDFTILMRKYFLGFVSARMRARRHMASQVGINPYGPEWTHLYYRLTKFSPYFICGDYKNFDKTTLPHLMMMYGDIVNAYYEDQHQVARRTLIEELVHTVHLSINKMWVSHHGNPSGNPITTDMNGEVNENLMLFAWLVIHAENAIETTLDEFYNYVDLIVYGDDNVLSVKREKTGIFHQKAIAYVLKQYFGITYTDASKAGVSDFISIDEVTFLKNRFVKHHNIPFVYGAALEPDTIREMCNWVRGSIDVKQMTLENATTSCRFAYFHGLEFYKQWVKVLDAAFKSENIFWVIPNYDEIDRWFLNQFEGEFHLEWFERVFNDGSNVL